MTEKEVIYDSEESFVFKDIDVDVNKNETAELSTSEVLDMIDTKSHASTSKTSHAIIPITYVD